MVEDENTKHDVDNAKKRPLDMHRGMTSPRSI